LFAQEAVHVMPEMANFNIGAWVIPLIGHQYDLEDLPLWTAGQDVHVAKRDGAFVLWIPAEIIGESPEPVRALAEDRLALVNGVGRLLSSAFRPVSLAAEFIGVDPSGATVSTVIALGTGEARAKGYALGVSTGNHVPPNPPEAAASPLMRATTISRRAHDALTIVGRPTLTWAEIYLLFELVEAEVGGKMFELGWVSQEDATLFCRTANSYSALGSKGRHGKDKGAPPPQPMQHGVAIMLIRGLVLAWLRYVGEPRPAQTAG